MKTVNIAELKNNLSKFIGFVEKGETIQVCKRNIPIASIIPHPSSTVINKTRIGCGRGTVVIKGDLTEPLIPVEDWHMVQDETTS